MTTTERISIKYTCFIAENKRKYNFDEIKIKLSLFYLPSICNTTRDKFLMQNLGISHVIYLIISNVCQFAHAGSLM